MSLSLEFHPSVGAEIDDAHDWYEQRRPGLEADFLDEVLRATREILAIPALYGFAEGDVRVKPMARFPYAMYLGLGLVPPAAARGIREDHGCPWVGGLLPSKVADGPTSPRRF